MIIKRYISLFLNSIFFLILLLFVLDAFTDFDIKNQAIKSFSYVGIIIITPIVLIWNLWFFKRLKTKTITTIVPLLTLVGILAIHPIKIIFSSASWQTQKVVYQNKHASFQKIEYQIQDVGALGYNKRTVEVTYLTNWFMIVHPVKKQYK